MDFLSEIINLYEFPIIKQEEILTKLQKIIENHKCLDLFLLKFKPETSMINYEDLLINFMNLLLFSDISYKFTPKILKKIYEILSEILPKIVNLKFYYAKFYEIFSKRISQIKSAENFQKIEFIQIFEYAVKLLNIFIENSEKLAESQFFYFLRNPCGLFPHDLSQFNLIFNEVFL